MTEEQILAEVLKRVSAQGKSLDDLSQDELEDLIEVIVTEHEAR